MLPTAQDLQELLDKVSYEPNGPVRVRLSVVKPVSGSNPSTTNTLDVKIELYGHGGYGRVLLVPVNLFGLVTGKDWMGAFLYQISQHVEKILYKWLQDSLRVNGKVI